MDLSGCQLFCGAIVYMDLQYEGPNAYIHEQIIKDKLLYFTVRDLQSLLAEIGLPKTGKKQELTDCILAILDEKNDTASSRKEEIARCIDFAFRNIKQRKRVKRKPENIQAIAQVPVKNLNFDTMVQKKDGPRLRCICGSSLPLHPIIQCEDYRCQIWQHAGCVIVPDAFDGQFNVPTRFLCEICRIQRADPFWVTMGYPLLPVKLVPSLVASDGSSPALSLEKTFVLTDAHMKLLQSTEHELQAWSMLMNDNVQFRMHWPLDSDFHINGTKLGVLNRPASQILGTNSRDDGPCIKAYCKEGFNKITFSWNDTRTFCIGIRIAKRQKISQVVNMILNNIGNEESIQDALARICRCMGGNGARSNVDSDFELVDDCVTINLRCPWQCPICLKNYSLENLVVDPFFTKITSMLTVLDEELTEIEVNLDGLWRLKVKDGLNGSEFPWISPNDSIYDPYINRNINLRNVKPKVHKPAKCGCSLIPISSECLITEENQSGILFEENSKDSQCDSDFIAYVSTLISPPCMDKEKVETMQDGRYADLSSLCNVSSYQQSASVQGLRGYMSMHGGGRQDDWISLSLAVGIVHPVTAPITESASTIHNLSGMSSFGLPPTSRGIMLPNATSNGFSSLDLEMLMNYNIFSPPVTPEIFHITDPNFQL